MHPTDTLLSLSHARIARAAAAGPRKATQPTALTDRQHMARVAQADGFSARENVEYVLAHPGIPSPEALAVARAAIIRLNTLARADGVLAQRIDSL